MKNPCFAFQDHIHTISQKEVPSSSGRDKNGDVYDTAPLRPPVGPHTAKMKVAKLMDSYLAEIARDGNLSFSKFQALAEALPEFSRITDDGLYRAIDTFLRVGLRRPHLHSCRNRVVLSVDFTHDFNLLDIFM